MLGELTNVPQQAGISGRRRWFADEELDLIVWYSASAPDEISGFQLCYDLMGRERAFTWRKDDGLMHTAVDSGEDSPLHNRSPILVASPRAPVERVIAEFKARSTKLETEIVELVSATLSTFNTPGQRGKKTRHYLGIHDEDLGT